MIDWQALGASLAQHLHLPPAAVTAQPMSGGNINQAFGLLLGTERFFVKLNRAERLSMFDAERIGLDAIRHSRTIRVPEVYLTGRQTEHAYIVMEYVELGGRPEPISLARALAAMHGSFHTKFGFHCDNTIGSTPQPNGFSENWIEFWRKNRLEFQLGLAAQNGFDSRLVDAGHRLSGNLDEFYDDYHPRPSLLHGDLWSGNQAADTHGDPLIYDPACYFGDHEADLAMMELFGNPGERFFAEYDEHFPIDAGYATRRDLYNLYHILNHANLFGAGYAGQAMSMIEGLLAVRSG